MTTFSKITAESIELVDATGLTTVGKTYIDDVEDRIVALETPKATVAILDHLSFKVGETTVSYTYNPATGEFTGEFPNGTVITAAELIYQTTGSGAMVTLWTNDFTVPTVVNNGKELNVTGSIYLVVYAEDRAFSAKYKVTTTVAA